MKKRLRRVLFALVATIIFGLGGCFASRLISYPIGNGEVAWWSSLGKPPDGAISFPWTEPNFTDRRITLYVETSSGKIYRCCTSEQSNWEEASLTRKIQSSSCKYDRDRLTKIRFSNLTLNGIQDCLVMRWAMEWIADDDIFVILEDGNVWKWHYYWGFDSIIGFGCGIPLLVEIIGWSVIVMLNRRKKSISGTR